MTWLEILRTLRPELHAFDGGNATMRALMAEAWSDLTPKPGLAEQAMGDGVRQTRMPPEHSARVARYIICAGVLQPLFRLQRRCGLGGTLRFTGAGMPIDVTDDITNQAIALLDARRAESRSGPGYGGTTDFAPYDGDSDSDAFIAPLMAEDLGVSVPTNNAGWLAENVRYIPVAVRLRSLRFREQDQDPGFSMPKPPRALAEVTLLMKLLARYISVVDLSMWSLCKFGYVRVSMTEFAGHLTDAAHGHETWLNSIFPGNDLTAVSGTEIAQRLHSLRPTFGPWPVGRPILRSQGTDLLVDFFSAWEYLVSANSLVASPGAPPMHNKAANDDFEVFVQGILDDSSWRPPDDIRALRGKQLTDGDGKRMTDIDSIATNGGTCLLINCKARVATPEQLIGDADAIGGTVQTLIDYRKAWDSKVASIRARPTTSQYDFAPFDRILSVICTTRPFFLPLHIAEEEVLPGLRTICTVSELASFVGNPISLT